MEEVWKPIHNYEGLYEISSFGRIKSVGSAYGKPYNKKNGVLLSQFIARGGYWTINLTFNGKGKQFSVHRLIGQHFIDNPENKPWINHKDGVKSNNSLSNLEWSTISENTKHAYDIGIVVNPLRKLVIDLETGIFYDSIKHAAYSKGITRVLLTRYLTGDRRNRTSFAYA